MAARGPTRPSLAQLTDLATQLRHDQDVDHSTLRQRDRRIGRELDRDGITQRTARLTGWLTRVWPTTKPRPGDAAARADISVRAIATVIGLILGIAAAAGMLVYDGRNPVNVFHMLGLFVGVQWLLLLLTLVAFVPARWTAHLPGFIPVVALQNVVTALSPGRLQGFASRWFTDEQREAWAQTLAAGRTHQQLFGNVHRWLVLDTAQSIAVAFNLGAVGATLLTIVLQDVAFVWSTTLQMDAATFHRITSVMSTPWGWFWPDAVPSLALVEQSRFFRLQQGGFQADAAMLGQWWPFVIASMVVWGLVPRVLMLLLARRGRHRAIADTFLHMPGVTQLEDRLNAALVETRAVEPQARTAQPDAAIRSASAADSDDNAMTGGCVVINWSSVPIEDAHVPAVVARCLGARTAAIHPAGGGREPADDDALIATLAADPAKPRVVMLVKSWEPPLGELLDFLQSMREALGRGRAITVIPVGPTVAGALTAPDESDRSIWSRMLGQIADPWLDMADWPAGETP